MAASCARWSGGRVAEGNGLLNRHTDKIRIGGSNPPRSAIFFPNPNICGGR